MISQQLWRTAIKILEETSIIFRQYRLCSSLNEVCALSLNHFTTLCLVGRSVLGSVGGTALLEGVNQWKAGCEMKSPMSLSVSLLGLVLKDMKSLLCVPANVLASFCCFHAMMDFCLFRAINPNNLFFFWVAVGHSFVVVFVFNHKLRTIASTGT